MNDPLAAGAHTTAALLAESPLPEVACVELSPDRVNGGARAVIQLATSPAELAGLVTAAGTLSGDVVASVFRFDKPNPFTQVEVDGFTGDVPVRVWTHPPDRELRPLWDAIGTVPDYGVRVRIDLDTLRAVAHAFVDVTA